MDRECDLVDSGVGRSRVIVLVCVILRSASDVDEFVWEKASFGRDEAKAATPAVTMN